MSERLGDRIIDLYERHALAWDRLRGRSLVERGWLASFGAYLPASALVLDLGCGSGEPLAGHFIASGHRIIGVDSAPAMIAQCRRRFPDQEWIVADMRSLSLGQRVDGLLAWDSFFHLTADDQRTMFPRFAAHARPGAPLLFTSGSAAGEAIGSFEGEPLYHASLDPDEYERLLTANGFAVERFCASDPACGDHTVWLAVHGGADHKA